jgi:hypothetical protein
VTRPGGRRFGPALAAALGGALIALVAVVGGPGPAAGAQAPPAGGGAQVQLVSQPSWVRPGERFDVRLRIARAPADAAVRLVVHGATDSRQAFRRTLDGELGRVLSSGTPVPIAELTPAPGGTVTTGFVAGSGGLGLPGRGVYPVEVQLLSAAGQPLDGFVTYLDYLTGRTPEFPPLDVAVVLDIGGGAPIFQPDGKPKVDPSVLARAEERVAVLRDTAAVPVTVAAGPEQLDGFAADPKAPPATVVDGLRTTIGGRPSLARPYVDVDLAALRQAGLASEARNQVNAGTLTMADLLRVKPLTGIWLSDATLGSDAARALAPLGFTRALVPPTAVDAGDDARVPQSPVRLGSDGPLGMVSDPALATHLTDGSRALGAQRFLAELMITWQEAPANRRGVAVRIPADATIDPTSVAVALNGLRDGQAVKAVPLDQLYRLPTGGGGPQVMSLAGHSIAHDLRPVASQVQGARQGIDGLTGLRDDAAQGAKMRRSLLVSTGVDTPDADRLPYVRRVTVALGGLQNAVELPEKFRITLTSRSSSIPVNVTNNTSGRLTVMVRVDSDQLEFPEGGLIATPLPPNTTTRLDVPVRVRTSGAFTMDVQVTSPDGTIVLDSSTFDVRSTAISGVGLVLSGGAALFLAVWWLRHWRSTRRSRHLMPRGAVPPDPPPEVDPAVATDPDGAPLGTASAPPPPEPGASAAAGNNNGAGPGQAGDQTDPGYRPAHLAAGRPHRRPTERATRPH